MTESEWLTCPDPTPMLEFLREKVSGRKLRLLGSASVRRVWHQISHKHGERAIEIAERFADGLAQSQDLYRAAGKAHWQVQYALPDNRYTLLAVIGVVCPEPYADLWLSVREAISTICTGNLNIHQSDQANLVRDIFVSPFRTVSIPSAWRTLTVTNLAQTSYEERALPLGELNPARLAVLSDALEESGCQDADILGHLRSPGPHVRGCWAVDLVLEKE